jgi:glycosyltransferase involved in cell wall biosynthesis
MVGPVVKIDEEALPRRANLHYLGQQPYALLPQLVAGWDVCLMPFALNESTAFISPTKTLEYMAAGKPVVSTPIHDVEAMFGDIVEIAPSADQFVTACRHALRESAPQKLAREERMRDRVGRHSWDVAAETIHRSLDAVLAATPAGDATASDTCSRRPVGDPGTMRKATSAG